MTRSRYALAITATLLIALGTFFVARAISPDGRPAPPIASPAAAAVTSLCQEQTASVSGGTYIVQNNEFDSSASECVTTDGNADFTVANSSIANATNGAPGAYPSIYQGCHWGNCSSGGLTSTPVQVSSLTHGQGDHELVHHPAWRQRQRLRRRLRHLDQPDADHLRPAQRNRDHGLAQPQRQRPAIRLRGRHQRQPWRAHATTSGTAPSPAGTRSPTT